MRYLEDLVEVRRHASSDPIASPSLQSEHRPRSHRSYCARLSWRSSPPWEAMQAAVREAKRESEDREASEQRASEQKGLGTEAPGPR